MTFDYDRFMKGVGLYEEANRRRDRLELDFAFSLYERAQEFLDHRLDVTVFYDMALASCLDGNYKYASECYEKCRSSLDQIKTENPDDTRIANLQPLADSLAGQLEFQKMVDNGATNYAELVQHKIWTAEKFALSIWISNKADHNDGFDNESCDMIYSQFKKWVERCQWFQITRANKGDENISRIVIKQAGEDEVPGGSAGYTSFFPKTGLNPDRVDIRVLIPSDKNKFQSLMLHEAGHALGIDGHSPFADDLMWWKSPLLEISKRDVETMKIIYGQ